VKFVNIGSRAETEAENRNLSLALQEVLRNSVYTPSEVLKLSVEDKILTSEFNFEDNMFVGGKSEKEESL